MQRDDRPKSLAEIKEQLQLQSRRLGNYHYLNTQDDDRPALAALPTDTKKLVCARYLNSIDAFNFFRSARRSLKAVHPDIARREDNPLRQLLSHAALGELEAAEKIWEKFPDLLTCRGTIYHPNRSYVEGQPPVNIPFHQNPGRYKYINRTFYQILLMNSEFEEAEAVGKLMTPEEKQKQFDEVFPDREIKKYDFDLNVAKTLLSAAFEAIAKDESIKIERDGSHNIKKILISDWTRDALHKLYAYAKPKSKHEIGLVFDPQFYLAALQLYDNQYKKFGQQMDRYVLWSICVEEWLAGCLGTFFLRVHAQGIGNSPDRRGCVLSDGSSYFAFRRAADSLPASSFFVELDGERGHGARPLAMCSAGGRWRSFASLISKLMSSNNESRDRIQQYLPAEKSTCLVC